MTISILFVYRIPAPFASTDIDVVIIALTTALLEIYLIKKQPPFGDCFFEIKLDYRRRFVDFLAFRFAAFRFFAIEIEM
ncbi:MAG TPA: hypothetical protein VI981_01930 [Candidatus Paceibacterota bacterium]